MRDHRRFRVYRGVRLRGLELVPMKRVGYGLIVMGAFIFALVLFAVLQNFGLIQ
jgi:hypothetical protein